MDSSSSNDGKLSNSSEIQTKQQGQNEKKHSNREVRFNVSLMILVSLACGQILLQLLSPYLGVIAHCAILLLAAVTYEWNNIHAATLTRHKRAFFDVSNVLETYQPRARTMGHLFKPEPNTPGVVKISDLPKDGEADGKNAQFNNARDSHYADMYEKCVKAAKEQEAIEKAASASTTNVALDAPLVPADPAKDKKEHEDKKQKEEEEYKKQLEKPFSC